MDTARFSASPVPGDIGFLLAVLSVVLAVFSVVWSLRQARQQKQQNIEFRHQNDRLHELLRHERQVFDWEAIHKACRALAKKLAEFRPDLIVTTPGAPLAVVALVVEELYAWIPVYIVMVDSPDVRNAPNEFESDDYEVVQSMNVKWYLPKRLLRQVDAKIAVVDDATFNSFYFETLLLKLNDAGMRRDNILTACLIVSEQLPKFQGIVDWYFYLVTNTVLHLPWGKEWIEGET